MGSRGDLGQRHVLPRWRSVPRTIAAGEFQRLGERRPVSEAHLEELERLETVWLGEKSLVAAAEFVGSSLVAGVHDRAAAAGDALLASGDAGLSRLGRRVTGGGDEEWGTRPKPTNHPDLVDDLFNVFRDGAAEARRRTIRDPRNPIAWVDLARRYTVLGEFEKAWKSLTVARSLAPGSRYILRATIKFLMHVGEPDRANRLLRASDRAETDPWLMASHVSVAASAGLRMPSMKKARRIVEHDGFREIERSELRSELATLELASGGDKKAKRLFGRALEDPTDNSLAQAEWAASRLPAIRELVDTSGVPFASEALCRAASSAGDWDASVRHAADWLDDQPFDADPAITASYAAAAGLDDWRTSEVFARLGLRSNPNNPILLNNLAYALAQAGDVGEAEKVVDRANAASGPDRHALAATAGLIAFRTGRVSEGERLYRSAITAAERSGEREVEAMARSMLLRELLRAGAPIETAVRDTLERLASAVEEPGVKRAVAGAILRLEAASTDTPEIDETT